MVENKSANKKSSNKQSRKPTSRPRRRKRDKFDLYGPALGQFRREHGRAKTYFLFLVCAVILCALLYLAYWLDMGH